MTPTKKPPFRQGAATIWSVSHVKGGCGKTVTAIQMAALLAAEGRPTVLGDFDVKGGHVGKFLGRREVATTYRGAAVVPPFEVVEVSGEEHLKDLVARCRRGGKDLVLDTHPAQANSLAHALTYSDIAIVPVRQGHTEMESWGTLQELLALIQGVRVQYRLKPLTARSLITDFKPTRRGRLMKDQMFFTKDPLYLGEVPHSEKFGDAILSGMALWEYLPAHPHSRQIREIIGDCIRH